MKRQYIKSGRGAVSVLLAAACASTLLFGCGDAAESAEEETMSEVIPVEAQMPVAGTLVLKNEFVGTVSPEESVYVIPMVTAEVLPLMFIISSSPPIHICSSGPRAMLHTDCL
ncbi:MAG: hypothetical protein HFI56_13890 [Lachnospiraceae bacterium]|nr:hypothetical protein [Lachnospiraceae bacterium]